MKAMRVTFRVDGQIRKLKTMISIALIISLVVTSCAKSDTKKANAGAVTGAAIGGAIGAVVGKNNRLLGALIGTALGAGAGFLIGRELDKKDKAALQTKVEEVAEKGRNGEPVSWESNHSGASATITPLENPKPIKVIKNISKVKEVKVFSTPLKMVTGMRVATTDVNIRIGPSTTYAVRDVLQKGEEVSVVGMTKDGWYFLEKENKAIGYVSGRYLKKPGERKLTSVNTVPAPVETKPQAIPQSNEKIPLQTHQTEEEVRIKVIGTCRPVLVRVKNTDGKIEEQTLQTCQGPDGTWGA